MLLQILDDGRLTDSQGRKVDFRNTVVIMTSNVGARLITEKQGSLGFASNETEESDFQKIRDTVMEELKKTFRPEFLNRVDDIIVFNKLNSNDIQEIARRMLKTLQKRVDGLNLTLSFTEEAIKAIAEAGFDPVYGARPLRRAIQSKIEDKLSEKMLEGKMEQGKPLLCDYKNGEFVFTQE